MKPEIVVYCLAYNHKAYIKKALEGFVQQKTDFAFKVVVHDDASTDGTQEIIRDYAKKYPSIIIPIFQEKNQYSKNASIYERFIQPCIDSKYTAICEGDDYWCNEHKLQLQYDYMESHSTCSLCVHNTEMINEQGNTMGKFFNSNSKDIDYTAADVIGYGPGGLFHTSSFLYRTELRNKKPDEFRMKYVGDYPLAVYLSCNGYVHYIGRTMSKYRVGSVNSWVKANSGSNRNKILHLEDMIESLNRMDVYTKSKYHGQFRKVINNTKFEKSILELGIWKTLRQSQYRKVFSDFSLKSRVKIIIKSIYSKG